MAKAAYQNTKIIATIGPACSSYNGLLELARVGVDIFRLNFSHGSHAEHLDVINHIVAINKKFNFHIGILADLQGPKIRIGDIEDKEVLLVNNQEITFTTEKSPGTSDRSEEHTSELQSRLHLVC